MSAWSRRSEWNRDATRWQRGTLRLASAAALVACSCLAALIAPTITLLALATLALALRRPLDSAARSGLDGVTGAIVDERLLWLLLSLWVPNVADFLLTWEGTRLGVFPVPNGVMAYFLGAGTAPAFAFKMLVMSAAVLAMWRLRAHPWVPRLALILVAAFAVHVGYEALALVVP